MPLGFIVHPTYRTVEGRPIVHLYGRAETGETFLAVDDRFTPYFFVRRDDRPRVPPGPRIRVETTDLKAMNGSPVLKIAGETARDLEGELESLSRAGVESFEADLSVPMRYLIDHRLRGSLRIEGTSQKGDGVDLHYRNPEVEPAVWEPRLKVLSIDIETSADLSQVYSIALYGEGVSEVLIVGGADGHPKAAPFPDEAALLRDFRDRLLRIDPDIITGWNVIEFDLAILERKFREHAVPFRLGRSREPSRVFTGAGVRETPRAVLAGRQVLDGIHLLRGAFVHLDDWRLETAARGILGEGKALEGADRRAAIEGAYRTDRGRLIDYNLADARLVYEIIERTQVVRLGVRRSLLTGMPLERVASSIGSFDFVYLMALRGRGYVAPTRSGGEDEREVTGGYVLEARPGIFDNVLVFDYRSLYPSLIRTFNIDPMGYILWPRPEDHREAIVAPSGACFRRDPAILPGIIARLFERREAARAEGDLVSANALKILMNSFYGVLAARGCRFYSPDVANAITTFGQEILKWTKGFIESLGYEVIYGDTDSIFVHPREKDPEKARAIGEEIRIRVREALEEHIRARYRVDSHLELELETVYSRFFLPEVRDRTAGSKKRYAGLPLGEKRIEYTGLEFVRRDWTELAKRFQDELLDRVFRGEPVAAFVRGFVGDLRSGKLDGLLVYRKAVRKALDAYTRTTPPHVKAARLAGARAGQIVEYVMTAAGPEPIGMVKNPIDHEHYVRTQLRPVADSILAFTGTSFDQVVGGERQLELFPDLFPGG